MNGCNYINQVQDSEALMSVMSIYSAIFKLQKEQCLAGVSVISIIYSGLWIVCLVIGGNIY